ncbi:hypothetical protein CPC08DRAFT_731435 [Agrocybe pediades]|nr:hypothetical protein CPC08DRAFT_731435 [Agrocybe pediades]
MSNRTTSANNKALSQMPLYAMLQERVFYMESRLRVAIENIILTPTPYNQRWKQSLLMKELEYAMACVGLATSLSIQLEVPPAISTAALQFLSDPVSELPMDFEDNLIRIAITPTAPDDPWHKVAVYERAWWELEHPPADSGSNIVMSQSIKDCVTSHRKQKATLPAPLTYYMPPALVKMVPERPKNDCPTCKINHSLAQNCLTELSDLHSLSSATIQTFRKYAKAAKDDLEEIAINTVMQAVPVPPKANENDPDALWAALVAEGTTEGPDGNLMGPNADTHLAEDDLDKMFAALNENSNDDPAIGSNNSTHDPKGLTTILNAGISSESPAGTLPQPDAEQNLVSQGNPDTFLDDTLDKVYASLNAASPKFREDDPDSLFATLTASEAGLQNADPALVDEGGPDNLFAALTASGAGLHNADPAIEDEGGPDSLFAALTASGAGLDDADLAIEDEGDPDTLFATLTASGAGLQNADLATEETHSAYQESEPAADPDATYRALEVELTDNNLDNMDTDTSEGSEDASNYMDSDADEDASNYADSEAGESDADESDADSYSSINLP